MVLKVKPWLRQVGKESLDVDIGIAGFKNGICTDLACILQTFCHITKMQVSITNVDFVDMQLETNDNQN